MNKNKSRKTLALLSISLVCLLVVGILSQSGVFVSAENYEDISQTVVRLDVVEILPSEQITNDGKAEYKVVFKDPHPVLICADESCAVESHKYKLSFEAREEGTEGKFDEDEFFLSPGEDKVIKLHVKTENKGTSAFSVSLEGEGVNAFGKALITYIPGGPVDIAFFVGKGFILNEDETRGLLVDFKILNKESTLSGKATIGKRTYRLEGVAMEFDFDGNYYSFGQPIKFDLFSLKSGEVVGTFFGNVNSFGTFKLLKGSLNDFKESPNDFKGNDWKLIATSGKKFPIIEASLTDLEPIEIGLEDVISVNIEDGTETTFVAGEGEDVKLSSEVYIKPVLIKNKKLFGFIPTPWGKKFVKVELVKGNKIFEKSISEYSGEIIEGYRISVGSLESEKSIAFKVEKA